MLVAYLNLGWHVLPLRSHGKEPLTRHGVNDASSDPVRVAYWTERYPGCNWGVDTGRSALLVVDLDGDQGRRTWEELVRQHGPVVTLTSLTGSGGRHIFFLDPTGKGRSTTRRVGAGIDTRGRGGYVVLPPSIHPSGQTYGWVRWPAEPVEVPAWLLERSSPPSIRYDPPSTDHPQVDEATAWGAACLTGILRRLSTAEKGTRHSLTLWAAMRAGQLHARGHLPDSARDAVEELALRLHADEPRDARRAVRDGWAFGLTHLHPNDPEPHQRQYTNRNVQPPDGGAQ